ncbi:MAG: hypothetical protein ACTSQU_00560 [Promethearchaeota archaeon]
MGKTFGILALICGILGLFGWLVLGFLPFGIYYLPGAAILFGIIGLIVDDSKGMSIAGLILGIFDIICILFLLPLFAFIFIMIGLGALL